MKFFPEKPPADRRLEIFFEVKILKNRRLTAGFMMRKPAPAEPAEIRVKNRRFSAGKNPAGAGAGAGCKSGQYTKRQQVRLSFAVSFSKLKAFLWF